MIAYLAGCFTTHLKGLNFTRPKLSLRLIQKWCDIIFFPMFCFYWVCFSFSVQILGDQNGLSLRCLFSWNWQTFSANYFLYSFSIQYVKKLNRQKKSELHVKPNAYLQVKLRSRRTLALHQMKKSRGLFLELLVWTSNKLREICRFYAVWSINRKKILVILNEFRIQIDLARFKPSRYLVTPVNIDH